MARDAAGDVTSRQRPITSVAAGIDQSDWPIDWLTTRDAILLAWESRVIIPVHIYLFIGFFVVAVVVVAAVVGAFDLWLWFWLFCFSSSSSSSSDWFSVRSGGQSVDSFLCLALMSALIAFDCQLCFTDATNEWFYLAPINIAVITRFKYAKQLMARLPFRPVSIHRHQIDFTFIKSPIMIAPLFPPSKRSVFISHRFRPPTPPSLPHCQIAIIKVLTAVAIGQFWRQSA